MFQKIPPKFQEKAVQSNILWLNINKINEISILQSADKQGNPSCHFHAPGSRRTYPCTHTAPAVPKYFSLSAPVLYWLSHLTCVSSLKAKNERKTLIFTQLKISRYKQSFSAIFRQILINWPPTYLLQSDHIPSTPHNTDSAPVQSRREHLLHPGRVRFPHVAETGSGRLKLSTWST